MFEDCQGTMAQMLMRVTLHLEGGGLIWAHRKKFIVFTFLTFRELFSCRFLAFLQVFSSPNLSSLNELL